MPPPSVRVLPFALVASLAAGAAFAENTGRGIATEGDAALGTAEAVENAALPPVPERAEAVLPETVAVREPEAPQPAAVSKRRNKPATIPERAEDPMAAIADPADAITDPSSEF